MGGGTSFLKEYQSLHRRPWSTNVCGYFSEGGLKFILFETYFYTPSKSFFFVSKIHDLIYEGRGG